MQIFKNWFIPFQVSISMHSKLNLMHKFWEYFWTLFTIVQINFYISVQYRLILFVMFFVSALFPENSIKMKNMSCHSKFPSLHPIQIIQSSELNKGEKIG